MISDYSYMSIQNCGQRLWKPIWIKINYFYKSLEIFLSAARQLQFDAYDFSSFIEETPGVRN